MATLYLARYLAREGKRVIVAAQLVEQECTECGVEFWDIGPTYDIEALLKRARILGGYHLISSGRAIPIILAQNEELCLSRIIISHDRSSNDTGLKPQILAGLVDQIVCVSNAQKDFFLADGVSEEKLSVIYNGVDQDIFSPGDPGQRDYKNLVFAGALVPDKGIDLLIESFISLKGKYRDLTLDVFGTAGLWGRKSFFDEKEIERNVPGIKFHGAVPQKEVASAYAKAAITVVPSIWFDPFPLSSIEAQVTGCPVVTFDVGGLAEGVVHGQTGIVIPEVSRESLTLTLDELLSSPDRLRDMSAQALKLARERFRWDKVARAIIKISEGANTAQEIKIESK
ncbi:MAG: glycosyltransferase family 4 protein, partial [Bdellovibrionales bacterium]|nr:glycosyltransferase family 4 protein [Bdellovibrionales bacterium]